MPYGKTYLQRYLSEMETGELSVDDILSELRFVYICLGIILPIIIVFGLIGNLMTICALCHRTLRSAPICLLQALTVNDIFVLVYSIYSDVEPAISSYIKAKKFVENLNNFRSVAEEKIPEDITDINGNLSVLFRHIWSVYERIKDYNFTMDNGAYKILGNSQMMPNHIPTSQETFLLCNSSLHISTAITTDTSSITEKEKETFIIKSLEHYIAYSFIHFGMLVMLCLATERCVAVWLPLKASTMLTVARTRLTIVLLFFLNCLIHLPQLVKDIILIRENPEIILRDRGEFTSLDHRSDYERFYAVSSIVMCSLLSILDTALLYKLLAYRKKLHSCRHMINAQRQEINITLVIVILLLFQLPVYIFINVIAFMKRDRFERNLSTFTRLAVIFRLIYVSQSALNFIIYCFFAKNVRKVLKLTYIKIIETVSMNAESRMVLSRSGCGNSGSKRSSDKAEKYNSYNKTKGPKHLEVIVLKEYGPNKGETV